MNRKQLLNNITLNNHYDIHAIYRPADEISTFIYQQHFIKNVIASDVVSLFNQELLVVVTDTGFQFSVPVCSIFSILPAAKE